MSLSGPLIVYSVVTIIQLHFFESLGITLAFLSPARSLCMPLNVNVQCF